MRYPLFATLTLSAGLLLAPSAFAQDEQPDDDAPAADSEAPEVRYKPKTEIEFDPRNVDGGISGPVGAYSPAMRNQQFNPLVRLKKDFDQEIVNSVYVVR